MITRPKLETACRHCRRGTGHLHRNIAKMAVQVRCDRCLTRTPYFVHSCNAIRFWRGDRSVELGGHKHDLHTADMVHSKAFYSRDRWVKLQVSGRPARKKAR